ncbi:MAG: proP [Tardiphaga sp.]|jgi:MFS family permease|nr:proP [Tardiphaga sp.]
MTNVSQAEDVSPTESAEGSIFAFYSALGGRGRKTFWACTAGWTLDGMDFMLFPLAIGTLVAVFATDAKTMGGIVSLTVLCSALGGWLAGFLADRVGRVRTMQITILLFSIGSLASAFAQDITQLMIARALLGVGFGGEAAVAAVTLSEVVAARHRGRAMGAYQASYAVGWGLAILIQAATFAMMPPESAWRVMFGIGALPAFLIFFIRRSVEEPALSVISRQTEKRSSIAEIFSSANIRATVSGSLLTIGAQGGFYALMTWVPQYLRSERKISILASTPYLLALISGCFLGYLTGGWLSDKFGRRPVFLFFSALAAGAVYAYTHLPLTDTQMLILGFPLGFFATGYYSALMACLNELFPTRVRGAGVGFTYNAGRAIGGTFPFLVGALAATTTLSSAITVFALISYGIVFVTALFLLRETKGAAL